MFRAPQRRLAVNRRLSYRAVDCRLDRALVGEIWSSNSSSDRSAGFDGPLLIFLSASFSLARARVVVVVSDETTRQEVVGEHKHKLIKFPHVQRRRQLLPRHALELDG